MKKNRVLIIVFVLWMLVLVLKILNRSKKQPETSLNELLPTFIYDSSKISRSTVSWLKFQQLEDLYDLAEEFESVQKQDQAAAMISHAEYLLTKYASDAIFIKSHAAYQVEILNRLAAKSDEPEPKVAFYRQRATKLVQRYKLEEYASY